MARCTFDQRVAQAEDDWENPEAASRQPLGCKHGYLDYSQRVA